MVGAKVVVGRKVVGEAVTVGRKVVGRIVVGTKVVGRIVPPGEGAKLEGVVVESLGLAV